MVGGGGGGHNVQNIIRQMAGRAGDNNPPNGGSAGIRDSYLWFSSLVKVHTTPTLHYQVQYMLFVRLAILRKNKNIVM
jgi:hypothetical protein